MSLCKRLIGSLVTQWAGGFAKYGCSQDTVRTKANHHSLLSRLTSTFGYVDHWHIVAMWSAVVIQRDLGWGTVST